MRDVETEARLRKCGEHDSEVSDVASEALRDVHVLEHGPGPQAATRRLGAVDVRVEHDVEGQGLDHPHDLSRSVLRLRGSVDGDPLEPLERIGHRIEEAQQTAKSSPERGQLEPAPPFATRTLDRRRPVVPLGDEGTRGDAEGGTDPID